MYKINIVSREKIDCLPLALDIHHDFYKNVTYQSEDLSYDPDLGKTD